MPSGYLHFNCAMKAATDAHLLIANHEAYVLGAQGPDPLFTLGIFPLRKASKPKPYGKMLHTQRTGAFLQTLLRLAKEQGPLRQAYALGFLTHYSLDSTVHPYVYANSIDANGSYSSPLHMRLEKSWDTLYHRRDGHKGTPVSMVGVAEAEAHWEPIATLWSAAICMTYDIQIDKAEIMQAFVNTAKINRLTHSPFGIKYGIMSCFERFLLRRPYMITAHITPRTPIHGDIENTAHLPWFPPAEADRQRNEGLPELFDTATKRAAALLKAASAFFEGEMSSDALQQIIGNVGYDTGRCSLP